MIGKIFFYFMYFCLSYTSFIYLIVFNCDFLCTRMSDCGGIIYLISMILYMNVSRSLHYLLHIYYYVYVSRVFSTGRKPSGIKLIINFYRDFPIKISFKFNILLDFLKYFANEKKEENLFLYIKIIWENVKINEIR